MPYKAILGGGFALYISRIHTAYIGEYHHFKVPEMFGESTMVNVPSTFTLVYNRWQEKSL